MRVIPPMLQYAQGRVRKVHARDPCKEPFPFQELLPLKLKDSISTKRDASSNVACLQEMTVLFTCLKTNEFNQNVCSKEISNFQGCYTQYMESKAALKKSTSGIGNKNLTPKQVNALLKKHSA